MLSARAAIILRSIVRQYIAGAAPIASQDILTEAGLSVSSATIRNEVARLEEEGYITRPHHAAGSVPSDRGYRFYVESIDDVELPLAEQRLVAHLFYQAEQKLDQWLSLASALAAQMVQSVAVVTAPKPAVSRFKHLEVISLKDTLALIVLVLHGAKVRQELLALTKPLAQPELTVIANRLNDAFQNLTRTEIGARETVLSEDERVVRDRVVALMEAEDGGGEEELYLDGLHFIMRQPEFDRSQRKLTLVELFERRNLARSIVPEKLASQGVQVIIGQENREEAIRDYSVVISRYGIPRTAGGTISVVGPTRMSYVRAISTVDFLSSILTKLVTELYGREALDGEEDNAGQT